MFATNINKIISNKALHKINNCKNIQNLKISNPITKIIYNQQAKTQLYNKQYYNFSRKSNISVKTQGFKSKLIKQKQQQLEDQQNEENIQQSSQQQNQDIDYRDIQISNEDEIQDKELQVQEDEDQPFNKEQIKFIRDSLLYKGDDPYPEKLVHRPEKGVVWGLGGQLIKKRLNFFTQGQWPTHEEIMGYLELEQAKDIICIDTQEELNRTDIAKYVVICSTFSCVHNFKIAKNLISALRNLQIPNQTRRLQISGQKDDEWLMVDFNNVSVHLFVEDSREEIDLEFRLRNPVPDDEIDEYMKIANSKKKQSVFEPLEEKY